MNDNDTLSWRLLLTHTAEELVRAAEAHDRCGFTGNGGVGAAMNRRLADHLLAVERRSHRTANYRCRSCGSLHLIGTAWIDLNTREVDESDPPLDDIWCRGCDTELHWSDVMDPHDTTVRTNGDPSSDTTLDEWLAARESMDPEALDDIEAALATRGMFETPEGASTRLRIDVVGVDEIGEVFVVHDDGTATCEGCARRTGIDLGADDTNTWEVGSSGWSGGFSCRVCAREIPVVIDEPDGERKDRE